MALALAFLLLVGPLAGLAPASLDDGAQPELPVETVALASTPAGKPVAVRAELDPADPAVAVRAAKTTLVADKTGVTAKSGLTEIAGVRLTGPIGAAVYTHRIPLTPDPAPEASPVDGRSVVVHEAAATPAPPTSPADWALAAQAAAPAAALAALAAFESQNAFRLRVPRGVRFIPLLAPLYSRIPRSRVLEHETRQHVYDLLQDTPGLSLEEIAASLELSRSTARHHLRVLEDAGLVRHAVEGRCRIHYPSGAGDEALTRHLLENPRRRSIVELLSDEPASLGELCQALDANAGSVHFHLRKLSEAGLVERVENGSVAYRLAGRS